MLVVVFSRREVAGQTGQLRGICDLLRPCEGVGLDDQGDHWDYLENELNSRFEGKFIEGVVLEEGSQSVLLDRLNILLGEDHDGEGRTVERVLGQQLC